MRTVIAIVWGLLTVLLGWFAATAKAPQIQEDVRSRTAAVVAPLNADAEVVIDGRFVTVKGPEPDDASKLKTLDAARGVYGALGPWDGLWVPKAIAAVAPMVSAVKDAGSLVLSGAVASEATKSAIADAAKATFAGAIDNRIGVTAGAAPADLPNLDEAFAALAEFDSGAAVLSPDRVVLSGTTGDKAVAEAAAALAGKAGFLVNVVGPAADASAARAAELEAALAKAKAELDAAQQASAKAAGEVAALKARIAELEKAAAGGGDAAAKLLADLNAAKAALAAAETELASAKQAAADCAARAEAADKAANEARAALAAANARIAELEAALAAGPAAPAAPAEPAAPAPSAESCNLAMVAAVAGRPINFETGSAVIAADAGSILDAVAAAAGPCARDAGLKMEVAGHTDDRGADAANLALSQRRAEAVRDALVLRSVAGEALSAVGYGETRPIGDNATEDGRRANRRIEFNWSAR